MHGLRSKAPLAYSNMYVDAVEIKLHEKLNVKLSWEEVLQQLLTIKQEAVKYAPIFLGYKICGSHFLTFKRFNFSIT